MIVHLIGYGVTFVASMLLGSTLGIRGYRRRQVEKLIHAVREAAQQPRGAPIAYVSDSEDGFGVLSPLTGKDMAQPGTVC